MNWLSYLMKAMAAVPYVVMGIQTLHGAATSGTDKKQLALGALGLATTVADAELPADEAKQADAVSLLIGNSIDGWVSAFHANNAPGFGTTANPTPAP